MKGEDDFGSRKGYDLLRLTPVAPWICTIRVNMGDQSVYLTGLSPLFFFTLSDYSVCQIMVQVRFALGPVEWLGQIWSWLRNTFG